MNSTPRHFLKLQKFPKADADLILELAKEYKSKRGKNEPQPLKGQTWALLFSKPSTRTRISFEVGINEMGGSVIFMNSEQTQMGRGERVIDTARVMGRMVHGMVFRTYDQKDIEDFADYSEIPTINALSDEEHPCQIMADILTFEEKRGSIKGKRVVFLGDASCNVARSWIYAAEIFDFKIVCAAPDTYQTKITNSHTEVTTDPLAACRNADLLYTDTWISMGKEDEKAERLPVFENYQINEKLLEVAKSNALVLHCLPAYRDKEISGTLFEARAKDIFDQAENRLHVQKGIMHWLVAKN